MPEVKPEVNPADKAGIRPASRIVGAFNTPDLKLYAPPIDGYVTHWFRGEPGRLQRALMAGWEFVHPEEIQLNNLDLAGDLKMDGNADLGERVSRPAQDGVSEDGQYLRLYLMKLKEEYRQEDQAKYEAEKIEPVVEAFTAGMITEDGRPPADANFRYRKKAPLPEMFRKKAPK